MGWLYGNIPTIQVASHSPLSERRKSPRNFQACRGPSKGHSHTFFRHVQTQPHFFSSWEFQLAPHEVLSVWLLSWWLLQVSLEELQDGHLKLEAMYLSPCQQLKGKKQSPIWKVWSSVILAKHWADVVLWLLPSIHHQVAEGVSYSLSFKPQLWCPFTPTEDL